MRFRQVGPSLVVHTPAKLNLFLAVTGRRADGYHDLLSVAAAKPVQAHCKLIGEP